MMPKRSIVALACATILGTVLGQPSMSGASTAPAPAMSVTGYAEAGSTSTAQLRASRGIVDTVGVDGINVAPTASHTDNVSAEALWALYKAHQQGQRADLLVGNFDSALGDFSPTIGDRLLGSTLHINKIVASLKAEVSKSGWDGVTIDLESLSSRYPAGLDSFVSKLKAALGPTKTVSICLMATSENDYAAYGYDLAGLGKAADRVVLMAYDQHGPSWSSAGPIGGQPWVAKALAPLLKTMPASKIQLGIAGYGYTWPKKGTGTQLSDAQARAVVAKAGAAAVWDDTQLEWHATLPDGMAIWWSDNKSYAARVAYARSQHLGGVAVWSLGLSDPLR